MNAIFEKDFGTYSRSFAVPMPKGRYLRKFFIRIGENLTIGINSLDTGVPSDYNTIAMYIASSLTKGVGDFD